MRKRSAKLTLLFGIIYLAFFLIVGFYFLTFVSNYLDNKIYNNAYEYSVTIKEKIDNNLKNEYQRFENLLENDNNYLNNDLPYFYLKFDNLNVNKATIDSEEFIINNNIELVITSLDKYYFVFKNEDRYSYFLVEDFFKDSYFIDDYLIVRNDGLIVYYKTVTPNLTNLNGFLLDDSEELVLKLLNKDSSFINFNTLDGEVIISYISLDGLDNYYYLNLYPYSDFENTRSKLLFIISVVVLLSMVAFFLFSYAFSHVMTSIYRDFELSYFHQSYNVVPIITINKSGRIKRKNKTFKKELPLYKRVKNIKELFDLEMLEILRLTPQKTWFLRENDLYSGSIIIPVKTSIFTYTLLMYLFKADDSDFIITPTIKDSVEVPSLNHYKQDIDQLLTLKKTYAHSQAVVVFKINNLASFETLRGENFTSNLVNRVYKQVESLLSREIDTNLYLSYDNYYILLYRDSDNIDIKADARRILLAIPKEVKVFEYNVRIDLSAGIYPFNYRTERSSALSIYDKAKKALSHKELYEGVTIGTYDAREELNQNRLEQIRLDLEVAIEKDEFVMYFQPQFDNEEKFIVGFEALLRWDNPKYEKNSIEEFIAVAEESDAILRLGELVLEKSMKVLKELESYNITVSINISPNQLLQAGFVNQIERLIEKHGVKAENLILEITETTLIPSFTDILDKIKLLKAYGIKIHIDDFGKGNSSLLYVKELQIDGIKIDRDFVKNILTDRYSKAVVNMIINLAKSLELDLVVEGVETNKQNEYLYKQGVKVIQGYLISKAVPFDNAVDLLLEYNKNRVVKKREVIKR